MLSKNNGSSSDIYHPDYDSLSLHNTPFYLIFPISSQSKPPNKKEPWFLSLRYGRQIIISSKRDKPHLNREQVLLRELSMKSETAEMRKVRVQTNHGAFRQHPVCCWQLPHQSVNKAESGLRRDSDLLCLETVRVVHHPGHQYLVDQFTGFRLSNCAGDCRHIHISPLPALHTIIDLLFEVQYRGCGFLASLHTRLMVGIDVDQVRVEPN